jgi:hypothetical protein
MLEPIKLPTNFQFLLYDLVANEHKEVSTVQIHESGLCVNIYNSLRIPSRGPLFKSTSCEQ